MPEGYKGWAQRADHLTAAEILEVVRASTTLGFRKFRLTGGEPLVREDIVEIAAGIRILPGVDEVSISTNATRLARFAVPLCKAGVHSLNISLDAIDPTAYREITGGNLDSVLNGISAAKSAGFTSIKLNCVLMRGVNEHQLAPLCRFAAEQRLTVRFIELMPLSAADVLSVDRFLSVADAKAILEREGPLRPLPDFRPGNGPARYFELSGVGAKVGFIGAVTTPDFCESCNKLRLTADGKIRPCLGQHGEIDLLDALRTQGKDIAEILAEAIATKPEKHSFGERYEPGRPMTAIGG